MPVRRVRVQWDVPMKNGVIDIAGGVKIGESDSGDGWFMNYRGLDAADKKQCVTDDKASEFGLRDGKTCFNGYYDVSHMFLCTGSESSGWNSVCPGHPEFASGCCVFKPRVQVLDNWDWCNGTCDGHSGCYNQGEGGHKHACTDPQTSDNPWLEYFGRVIVRP